MIGVVGAGYVGLVQALGLAKLGHRVVCVDIDADRVALLRRGHTPIFEDGLEPLLKDMLAAGTIEFSDSHESLHHSPTVFIAVGTPTDPHTDSANLSFLMSAIDNVAQTVRAATNVVVKSTIPIGTCERLQKMLDRRVPEKRLEVVSNPEFLREGCALADFFNPERIVIGGRSADAIAAVRSVYRSLDERNVPFVTGDWYTAETIKYAANAFLATKLTFINEIANLTEVLGGDIETIAKGIGLDSRIGDKFLRVGPGYGGSCFPKDTLALATTARRYGLQQQILESVIAINDGRRFRIIKNVSALIGKDLASSRITVLGLAFKAGTDDVRDSPAIGIVHSLLGEGAEVRSYDPVARYELDHPGYRQEPTIEDAARDSDLILIITEWPEFSEYDFGRIETDVAQRNIYDLRMVLRGRESELKNWNVAFIGSKIR